MCSHAELELVVLNVLTIRPTQWLVNDLGRYMQFDDILTQSVSCFI